MGKDLLNEVSVYKDLKYIKSKNYLMALGLQRSNVIFFVWTIDCVGINN